MKTKSGTSFLFFLLFIFNNPFAVAQDSANDKYVLAYKLKKESKFSDSFAIFTGLLKSDSTNEDYLYNTSFLYTKLGFSRSTEKEKLNYYHTGEYLAKKALQLNSKNANAHYCYALALGRLNENASNKQKISNAKLIKTECDIALQLDPTLAGCHHILGRWHRTIAGFNSIEKFMINNMFGGFPKGGSYEAAIESFQKAIQIEPKYNLHYYELAQTYYERNKDYNDFAFAKAWAGKALAIPPNLNDPDDVDTREKCKNLLAKIK